MELIQELFFDFLKSECFKSELLEKTNLENVLHSECYKVLKKIKEIICNKELKDSECFAKIEEIVCLFESKGIDCGGRHDF